MEVQSLNTNTGTMYVLPNRADFGTPQYSMLKTEYYAHLTISAMTDNIYVELPLYIKIYIECRYSSNLDFLHLILGKS